MPWLSDWLRLRLAAFRALPPDLAASGLVLIAFMSFTLMGVLAREAGRDIPVAEMIFIRQLLAYIVMAPMFWRRRREIRETTQKRLHLLRGASTVGGMYCGLSAAILIPFADATAIQMSEVLTTTIAAALLLGETISRRRWVTTAVGFVGVLVMLGPFSDGFKPTYLIPLGGALSGTASVMALRLSAGRDSTVTILFYQGLVVLAFFAPFLPWQWVTPTPHALAIVLLMGLSFIGGNWIFTTAVRIGRASALTPLNYVRLLFMSVTGYWLYGEVPSLATFIGAGLILVAASQTLRTNAEPEVDRDGMAKGDGT